MLIHTDWQNLNQIVRFIFLYRKMKTYYAEYEKGWKVTDIFPINSVGIVTAQRRFNYSIGLKMKLTNHYRRFFYYCLKKREIKYKFRLTMPVIGKYLSLRKT